MRIEVDEPYPIPDDPLLAEAAMAMRDAEEWGLVVDADWRVMYMADQNRLTDAGGGHLAATTVGEFLFDPHFWHVNAEALYGAGRRPEVVGSFLAGLADSSWPTCREVGDELIEGTDPALHDVVDETLEPVHATVSTFRVTAAGLNALRELQWTAVAVRDHLGVLHGTALLAKLALPAEIVVETLFQR